MRYYLFISVSHFYIQAHAAEQNSLLIIHKDKTVLDASGAAQSRGIAVGISLAEAKAILGGEGAYLLWKEEDYAQLQTQWLDLCTEASSIIEPEQQHTAWLDLSTQADPYYVANQLKNELTKAGLQAHLGLARSKWLAKLAAENQTAQTSLDWEMTMHDCVQRPEQFLAPFPVEKLAPVEPENRRRLRFLGYPTIGQVAALPRDLLQQQFGLDGLTIHRACRGGPAGQIFPLYPKDALQTQFTYPGAADTWEQLFEGVTVVAKRLGTALKARDAQSKAMELCLEYEDESRESRQRTFIKPLTNERTVQFALKLLLDPVCKPVAKIQVRLPGLAKVTQVQQSLTGYSQQNQKGLTIAVNALHSTFGQGAIQRASEISQSRRTRLLKLWQEATGWR